MVQIIEENKRPSFGQRFSSAVGAGLESGTNLYNQHQQSVREEQENKKLKELTGLDVSGLSPEIKQSLTKELFKNITSNKDGMAQNAHATLDRLESMIDKSGIGFMGQLNQTGDAVRNRGEFDAATASLLPMFKAMFPRGFTEKEFKIIRDEYIPNSSDREEKIRGKIQGLKHLVAQMNQGKSFDEARGQDLTAGSSKESEEEFVSVKSPSGKVKKIPKTQLKAALQAGGEEV